MLVGMIFFGVGNFSADAQTTGTPPPQPVESTNPTGSSAEFAFQKYGGIEYRSWENYKLTLDVYVPEGVGPWPAILTVHGGAWRSGTKLNWVRHARKLARAGFVVVAINYRHAPEFKFPAQIYDCKAAVRWMRMNASQYKIDPDRIGGLGYSAGGHLVALLGTTDADDGLEGEVTESEAKISTRLQAVAAGGAPCDFEWIDEDSDGLDYWLGTPRSKDPEIWKRASPAHWLTPDDPPFHFFHGTLDRIVPSRSAQSLCARMRSLGIEAELVTYPNGHFGLFSNLDAMDPVIEFFRKHL
jgi:acetyl esterase/lipase